MKVKTLISMWYDKGPIKSGSLIEMNEAEALVNIARKFVEPAEDEKPVEAPANTETASPESLVGSTIQIPGVVGSFDVETAMPDGTLVLDTAEGAGSAEESSEAGEDAEEGSEEEKPVEAPAAAPKQSPKQAPKANSKKR